MKNKRISALVFLCILSLAGLLFLAIQAEKKQYQDLIIAVPDGSGFPSLDLNKINEICNEEIAITYDIRKRVIAETTNSKHSVTLIGTNSSYAEVAGLQTVMGSFWSGEAWNMRSRYVILNEPTAFQLFGSSSIIGNTVKLDGELWMVTGIVKDGNKKNKMAYVPASAITGSPEVLMAKTEGGTGAVLNGLSRLGIYESNSRVIDVSAVALLFWQQFCVSVYLAIILLSCVFCCKRIALLGEHFGVIRLRYQIMYPDELIIKSRRELRQMACQGLSVLLSGMISLLLARQILQMALGWKDVGKEIKYLSDYFFQAKMQWLMRYWICGPVLFSVFAVTVFIIVGVIGVLWQQRRRMIHGHRHS